MMLHISTTIEIPNITFQVKGDNTHRASGTYYKVHLLDSLPFPTDMTVDQGCCAVVINVVIPPYFTNLVRETKAYIVHTLTDVL